MAKRGGEILKERLSRDYEDRSGLTFYSEQGVYSSDGTIPQYPQEVTGALKNSVGSVQHSEMSYRVGVGLAAPSGQPQSALLRLNNGSADGLFPGRFFMERTFNDADVQREMLEAQ